MKYKSYECQIKPIPEEKITVTVYGGGGWGETGHKGTGTNAEWLTQEKIDTGPDAPPVHESGVFRQEWIRYYHPDTLKDKELTIFGFFDPSLESGASSDYKAVLTVGLAVNEMVFYVMDAFIQKTTLENTLRTIANRFKEYGHHIIGVEDNLFQRLLLTEFDRLGKETGLTIPIKGVTNKVAKEARIISLSPLLERGKIRFIRGQSDQELLIEQLLYFPSKTINDDGPDALEGCLRMYKLYGISKGIDTGPDAPPINISDQQPRWYHKLVLWILGFATIYILWQALKLIVFYCGQHAINSAIKG